MPPRGTSAAHGSQSSDGDGSVMSSDGSMIFYN